MENRLGKKVDDRYFRPTKVLNSDVALLGRSKFFGVQVYIITVIVPSVSGRENEDKIITSSRRDERLSNV